MVRVESSRVEEIPQNFPFKIIRRIQFCICNFGAFFDGNRKLQNAMFESFASLKELYWKCDWCAFLGHLFSKMRSNDRTLEVLLKEVPSQCVCVVLI